MQFTFECKYAKKEGRIKREKRYKGRFVSNLEKSYLIFLDNPLHDIYN